MSSTDAERIARLERQVGLLLAKIEEQAAEIDELKRRLGIGMPAASSAASGPGARLGLDLISALVGQLGGPCGGRDHRARATRSSCAARSWVADGRAPGRRRADLHVRQMRYRRAMGTDPRRALAAAAAALVAGGCGTYSMVRPARTLPAGEVELAAGVAASNLGEVNTILHAAVGVGERVEVLAQNEIWNTFGEARYAVLSDAPSQGHGDGVGLVVGVGGGRAVTVVSAVTEGVDEDEETVDGAAATVSVAVGKSWDAVSVTLGHRSFFLASGYLAASTRLGVRLHLGSVAGVFLETGGTVHAVLEAAEVGFVMVEGAAGLWVGF